MAEISLTVKRTILHFENQIIEDVATASTRFADGKTNAVLKFCWAREEKFRGQKNRREEFMKLVQPNTLPKRAQPMSVAAKSKHLGADPAH